MCQCLIVFSEYIWLLFIEYIFLIFKMYSNYLYFSSLICIQTIYISDYWIYLFHLWYVSSYQLRFYSKAENLRRKRWHLIECKRHKKNSLILISLFLLWQGLFPQYLLQSNNVNPKFWRQLGSKSWFVLKIAEVLICCPNLFHKLYFITTETNFLPRWTLELGKPSFKTSQELRMLSSVTLDCQVRKIVMNSGSQL